MATATYTVPPTSTMVERNVPCSGVAVSLSRMRSRRAATNQISAKSPSPVRIQPMWMCVRLLELWYQDVIFAGDESLGPSKSSADPTTARTTKTSPARLDQSRKPLLAIQNPPWMNADPCSPPRGKREVHCVPMGSALSRVLSERAMGRAGIEPATFGLKV